jgi:SagB-type dehydrogenase family enzyme
VSAKRSTVRWSEAVYGPGGPRLDDAAELYHEASSAYPCTAAREARGVRLLEVSPEVRMSATRAVKRHDGLARVELPAPARLRTRLYALLHDRRSVRDFGRGAVKLAELSGLLHSGYGVTGAGKGGTSLRAVPSGGALYPLELYVLAAQVGSLRPGLYHFDPLEHDLERARDVDAREDVLRSMIFRDVAEQAAAVVVVTAMFWRTRFKYGLRGYRFALLEAGHVVQNLLLAAAAYGLGAVPIGGFYDRLLASALGVDGVDEAPIYAVCVGRSR